MKPVIRSQIDELDVPDNHLLDAKIESLSRCVDRITTHTPDLAERLTRAFTNPWNRSGT